MKPASLLDRASLVAKRLTIAFFAIILAAVPIAMFAQNFTGPGSLNEFSDAMVETPDTSMSVQPSDPILSANGPNDDEQVTPDPNYTQPQEPYSPDLPETVNTYEGPIGVTGIFNGNVQTACGYDPLNHSAHRAIVDIPPIPGSLGKYPLQMVRYYNSRQQYYALASGGLSPGWSHEYSWLLYANGKKVVSPHGSVYDFSCGKPVGVSEGWDDGVQGQHANGGIWRLADGGKVVFSGGHVTDIYDPYGLRTRIAYNLNGPQIGERVKVTEPGGRCLWFIYGDQDQDGTWLITRVEAYDSDVSPGSPTPPGGHLINWVNYTHHEYDPIIPSRPNRIKKMLWRADYPNSTNILEDNTHAHYDYRTDNVIEGPTSHKMYPLLKRCDDVRYNGPMCTIWYDYQNAGPHGAIVDETCPGVGVVSGIAPGVPARDGTVDTFTESRGDGPTRTFTYTHFDPCVGDDCDGVCAAYGESEPHNRMLDHYTDFQGNITQLGYDQSTWYITSVTDANNHLTIYERGLSPSQGGIGEIKKIIHHPDNSFIQYTYYQEDNALDGHYLQTIRDENGHITTLNRDGRNRIYQIDYPQDANTPASHEAFTFCDQADSQCNNTFGQVKRHQLKNGAYVHYRYDSRGLLIDKWEPTLSASAVEAEPKTHYEYYTSGPWTDRVKKVTMPANFPSSFQATETYEYDKDTSERPCKGRGLITKIIHTDNTYQSFSYDQWGNKIHEWNELGQRTDYAQDSYNRVITVTNRMGGLPSEVTSYTYNPTNGTGTSPYLHTTSHPDTVTSPTGILTSNVYDKNFRKTSTSLSGRTTWFHYDAVGNLECVTDPRGSGECPSPHTPCPDTTRTDYDTRNRKWHVWDAQGYQTTLTYDDASNVTRIDRPGGTWEEKTYDAVNRVRDDTVSFTGGNPAVSLTTWFTYHPSGTIWKVTDARGSVRGDPTYTTVFQYNASDQRIGMTYPPVNGHSDTQGWQYDNAHNLIWHITADGQAHYFAYDQRNRNYEQFWWDAQNDWLWYYFGPDAASRLRDAKNGTGSVVGSNLISRVHRDYDAAGRVTLDRQTVTGLATKDVNYEYDISLRGTAGSPTRMYVSPTPSPNYDYDFRYDDMGRFEKILRHSDGSLQFLYSYDPASNETQRHNQLNGVDEFYNPDNLNRPTTVDLQHNGSRFARELYDYSATGRLHTVTRLDNKQDEFGYYLDGELFWVMYGVTGVSAPNPDETPPADDPTKEKTVDDFLSLSGWDPNQALTADRSVNYNLDNAGNRNSVNDSVNGFGAYTPDNVNRYTDQVGNDPITNGNRHEVISYKNINYTYKDEHLISVTNTTTNDSYQLAYDALGRCVKRTVNGVTKYYIYDGERPILEYKSNGNLAGKNLYGKGIDEILMRYDPTLAQEPRTLYYQHDHEGSVTHLTDTGGNVIEKYRYDVFGVPTVYDGSGHLRPNGSAFSNRFMFTGREFSNLLGFYEYRARAYHPGLGRFMSEDPKLFDAGDYNLFRYCRNDPIDITDPMGLDGISNGDGTYHFVVRSDVVVPNIIGSYVVNKTDGTTRQCAGAAQFLTGTRTADGTLHDAPPARYGGWTKGAPVTKDTPNGTLVARRWENGVYPNKDIKDYNAEAVKKDPSIINHAGIKVGWDNNTDKAIILDQWKGEGGSLQQRPYDTTKEDWSVVNAKTRYGPQPSTSDFNVQIKKGTQDAQGDASNVIHSKPNPQGQ